MQNQQFELDLLNERGREVLRLADVGNKKAIESQLSEISAEWRELVSGLEGRRNALEALSRHWEDLEGQWALIETRLAAIEEKSKLVDTVVRSKQHSRDTVKSLEVSSAVSSCERSVCNDVNRHTIVTLADENVREGKRVRFAYSDDDDKTWLRRCGV